MKKIGFKNGEIVREQDLKEWEDNISHIEAASKSLTGQIKEGLTLNFKDRKIEVEKGYGYSADGKIKTLNENTALNNDLSDEGYIFLDGDNKLNFTLSEIKEDPYLYLVNKKNVLIIGMIKSKELCQLNRDYQMPMIPIGTVMLTKNSEFKDFITLRGCKKATNLYNAFLKFDSKALVQEEKSTVMLRQEQIPSFSLHGKTNLSGKHKHSYEREVDYGTMWDDVRSNWVGHQRAESSYDGDHEHSASATFAGISVPFSLEPSHAVLIPIIRIY